MKSNKSIFNYIEKYFNEYLLEETQAASNTFSSYKDTFKLIFIYIREKQNFKVQNFNFEKFNKEFVLDFLSWLEIERKNKVITRNYRLTIIKSFVSYVFTYEINNLELYRILQIKLKKTPKIKTNYLHEEEMTKLLSMPDLTTKKGRRDGAILSLLYDAGMRINELLELKVENVEIENHLINITKAKRNKHRQIPISKNTINLIKQYIEDNSLNCVNDAYLFSNNKHEKLSSNAIRKKIKKYVTIIASNDSNFPNRVHPHMFRHSKATHLINKNINVLEVKDFLGHESLDSTQVYITTDIIKKKEALETIEKKIFDEKVVIPRELDNPTEWLNNL